MADVTPAHASNKKTDLTHKTMLFEALVHKQSASCPRRIDSIHTATIHRGLLVLKDVHVGVHLSMLVELLLGEKLRVGSN